MDVVYFLKERTNFIRFYYDQGVVGFAKIKHQIDGKLPPFDDPPYSEDPEPAYLDEWMDAEDGIQIVGLSAISLLSDSLKLYFYSLRHRVIGFSFGDKQDEGKAFKQGFVAAYAEALGHILDTDWSDCPADLQVIEQIVLARNRAQHGSDLTSLHVSHDQHTLDKHPRPFFMNEHERESWIEDDHSTFSSFMMPSVKVTRETLFAAIKQVEELADWIESRMDKVADWRVSMR